MSKILFKLALFVSLISVNVSALEYVPEVYRDEYVTVRSGIAEAGNRPINLGDRLTLRIEIDFRSKEVLVENLSEEIFRRNWGSEKALVMLEAPAVALIDHKDGRATLRGEFPFEVLDCPAELPACPGPKVYPLPVISLGYQIIDASGKPVNNKSIRFNSWPGSLIVTPVLPVHHEGLEEFSTYFPGGAFSGSLAFTEPHDNGLWAILAGGLLLLTSFMPALFTSRGPRRVEVSLKSGKRWENTLALLQQNRSFTDEEWSDMIRRCTVWYCTDEYGINPYSWLASPDKLSSPSLQAYREYLAEVLDQETIEKGRRADFLSRFGQLTGITGLTDKGVTA